MKTAGIAELKARLSEYLDQVKSGTELVVTERGVPVARIIPLDTTEKRHSRRDRLVRSGLLRPGRSEKRRLGQLSRGTSLGREVLKLLLEEREEQR